MITSSRWCLVLAAIGAGSIFASTASADPYPDQYLKFYQMPLNNGAIPYLPVPSWPPAVPPPALPPYGTPSKAIYPGHDEFSTAYAIQYIADPILGPVPVAWQGEYMADDFADYAGTPISHVRWWGSYLSSPTAGTGVKKFLISFEHNIPSGPDPSNPGTILPSRPDPFHPGNLHQIVDLIVPPAGPPPAGHFTEKLLPTPVPPGAEPPREALFEYNAELHLDKWFYEKRANPQENNVYWLKIVALVDPQRDGQISWGWHNRDWSIPNALAAKPGDTPDGAERVIGAVPGPGGAPLDVWHFEDDAVAGGILVSPGMSPIMPLVYQTGAAPQNYLPPWDGPTPIIQYSKDLAFELYTRIPEPTSMVLVAMMGLLTAAAARGRQS